MSIRFYCSNCDYKLKGADEQIGRQVRCSDCGAVVTVPAVSEPRRPSTQAEPIKFKRREADSNADIDLTPMIDVVFQLLIFFMVTAAFGLQKSLDLPPSDPDQQSQQAATIEELEQDDDYVVVRVERDSTIWVNDSEAVSEQDLFAKLRQARTPGGSERGANRLLVIAHGGARHERVVQALDAGSAAGMESVKLATVDEK